MESLNTQCNTVNSMVFHLEISFKKSRSKDFSLVLKHGREFDYFKESIDFKLEIYSVEELFLKWEHFNIIHHYTRKWSGTTFSINDTVYLGNEVFYSLQEVKDCYKQYQKSYDKQGFCDASEWGCHKLKSVGRFVDQSFGPYWYDYGKFTNETTWKIDKRRILNILTEESSQKKLHFCPVFNEYKITSTLLRLPDSINVDGKKWQKTSKLEYRENGPVWVPFKIEHGSESEYEEDAPEFFNNYPEFEMPENITDDVANSLIELHLRHKSNQ